MSQRLEKKFIDQIRDKTLKKTVRALLMGTGYVEQSWYELPGDINDEMLACTALVTELRKKYKDINKEGITNYIQSKAIGSMIPYSTVSLIISTINNNFE